MNKFHICYTIGILLLILALVEDILVVYDPKRAFVVSLPFPFNNPAFFFEIGSFTMFIIPITEMNKKLSLILFIIFFTTIITEYYMIINKVF